MKKKGVSGVSKEITLVILGHKDESETCGCYGKDPPVSVLRSN